MPNNQLSHGSIQRYQCIKYINKQNLQNLRLPLLTPATLNICLHYLCSPKSTPRFHLHHRLTLWNQEHHGKSLTWKISMLWHMTDYYKVRALFSFSFSGFHLMKYILILWKVSSNSNDFHWKILNSYLGYCSKIK